MSSGSDVSDTGEAVSKHPDIIDLSDSPPQKSTALPMATPSQKDVRRHFNTQSLYADDDSDANDESILIL